MQITYDTEADALYIKFMEGDFGKNEEVAEGAILDISQSGGLLGIEILGASHRFPPDALAHGDIQMPLHLAQLGDR